MPTPDEKKRLRERALREIERRRRESGAAATGSPPTVAPPPAAVSEPSILDRAEDLFTQGINSAQHLGNYALRELSTPDMWRSMAIPVPGMDSGLPVSLISPLARDVNNFVADSDATKLLAARAYQGLNPFVAGEVGNAALEDNPIYQHGALDLIDNVGEGGAAALQFGSQILPGLLAEGGAGALAAAPAKGVQLGTSVAKALPGILARAGKGGLATVYTNAAMNSLGAREGERGHTFVEGLSDPTQLALGFALGGLPSAAGEVQGIRSKQKASAKIQSEILAEVMRSRQIESVTRPYEQPGFPMPGRSAFDMDGLPDMESITRPWEQVDGRTMAEMDPDARAAYVIDQANQFQQNLPTIVDPDIHMEIQARVDAEKLWTDFGGKAGDLEVVINGNPTTFAELMTEVQLGKGKQLRRIASGTETQLGVPFAESGSRGDATNAGTPKRRRMQEAQREDLSQLRVPPNHPRAAEALPSVADMPTIIAANGELPNPRAAAQRANWKTTKIKMPGENAPGNAMVHVPRRASTPREIVPNHYPFDSTMAIENSPLKSVQGDAIYSAHGVEAERIELSNWHRAHGNPAAGELGMSAFRDQATRKMGLVDRARIQGESPALIHELEYGPGRGNMGAARTGKDTQVMWNRDILKAQDRKNKGLGETVHMDRAQVEAEINAKMDARTVETPGDPVQPGGLPKDVDVPGAALEDAAMAIKRIKQARNPNLLQEMAKKALLPEFRAGPLVGAAIRGMKAAQHIQNVQVARVFPALKRAYDAARKTGGHRIIDRFIEQNLALDGKVTGDRVPVEALPREFRELFQAGMEQSQTYRNELIKAGYFTPEQVKGMNAAMEAGQYWLHKDYRAMMDHEFLPSRDRMDRAIRWLVKKGKGRVTYDMARAELTNLLTADVGQQERFMRFRKSKLNAELFKGRGQIPPIIRDVLGEIRDPAYVTASSMSEIERLWRQHKVSESFTSPEYKGKIWSDTPDKNMHEAKIWDDRLNAEENRRTFGMFAGKYVAPQLYESIMQAPAPVMHTTVQKVLSWVSGAFKTAKVAMSPVTYMNNWVSNSAYAAAAGLPVWNGRWAPRMIQSAKALTSYGDAFLTPRGKEIPMGGDAQWVQWALEDGGLIAGTGAEFGGSQARTIAQQFLRDPQKGMVGFLSSGWDLFQKGKAKAGSFYDALDSHWRLAVYIEQVTKGRERLGLSVPEARARAARIVNENFASSGSVGEGVREMSRQTGFLAPFMTWHADNLRVHANWLKNSGKGFAPKGMDGSPTGTGHDLLSGEGSGQAFNVAMHYGLISGIFEGMRRLYNWSDQETAAAEASLKASYRANNPQWVRQWLPWRDSKGRAQVISLVPLFPSAMFLKGDPKHNLLVRAATSTLLGFVQSGAAEDPVRRGLASVGLAETDFRPEVLPGQEGRAAIEAAWNYLEPGFVRDARNIARRLEAFGTPRRFEEKYTPGQAISALTPFRVEPVGAQSQESERRREVAQVNEAKGNQNQINKLQGDPAEKQRLRAKALEELQRRTNERSKRAKNLRQ